MEFPDLNTLDDIILTIEEEDGTETECTVIAMFEYEDEAYAAVTPTDEDVEDVYLFGLEMEEQGDEIEFTLSNIDDEDKLEEVGQVFSQILSEMDDDIFVDDDDDDDELYESESASDSDEDDDKWDEFIHKKIDELP